MTTKLDFPDPLLVDRYLTGTASDEERTALAHQLTGNTAVDDAVVGPMLRYGGVSLSEATVLTDQDALLRRISNEEPTSVSIGTHRHTIQQTDIPLTEGLAKTHRRQSQPSETLIASATNRWVRYGATAVVLIIAALSANPITSWLASNQRSTQSPAAREYVTRPGQRAVVTLPDGSMATLAPDTRLTMSGRTATLVGEALFTVTQRTDAPFVVHAGTTTIRVLGTTFAVHRYADDPETRVAIAQGKVMVQDRIVTNGDIALARSNNDVIVTHDAERTLALIGFAQGQVLLDDVTLQEAIPQLERWLGVDIQLEGAIPLTRFSITFDSNAPMQTIAEIARGTQTDYTARGRTITFRSPTKR